MILHRKYWLWMNDITARGEIQKIQNYSQEIMTGLPIQYNNGLNVLTIPMRLIYQFIVHYLYQWFGFHPSNVSIYFHLNWFFNIKTIIVCFVTGYWFYRFRCLRLHISDWPIKINSVFNLMCLWGWMVDPGPQMFQNNRIKIWNTFVISTTIYIMNIDPGLMNRAGLNPRKNEIYKKRSVPTTTQIWISRIQFNWIGNRRTIQFVDNFWFVCIRFVVIYNFTFYSCSFYNKLDYSHNFSVLKISISRALFFSLVHSPSSSFSWDAQRVEMSNNNNQMLQTNDGNVWIRILIASALSSFYPLFIV